MKDRNRRIYEVDIRGERPDECPDEVWCACKGVWIDLPADIAGRVAAGDEPGDFGLCPYTLFGDINPGEIWCLCRQKWVPVTAESCRDSGIQKPSSSLGSLGILRALGMKPGSPEELEFLQKMERKKN